MDDAKTEGQSSRHVRNDIVVVWLQSQVFMYGIGFLLWFDGEVVP